MPESIQEPSHKEEHREALFIDADSVEQWVFHEVLWSFSHFECGNLARISFIHVFIMLKVEEGEIHDRDRGETDVVQLVDKWLIQRLTREGGEETEEILSRYVDHIFVEVVQNKCRVSSVGLSAVYEHERLEVFELADSIICTPGSLLAFFTEDTNSYVSLQYHTYVICTVANRQRGLIRELFSNHRNYVSFLFRGYSAGENDVREIGRCQELVLQVWI